jgi:hypothetical protein
MRVLENRVPTRKFGLKNTRSERKREKNCTGKYVMIFNIY